MIFTCGAQTDRKLGIPGESLPGSYTATEFVGWYNGHPDYRDREFDLSHEAAVVIGQGKVAADVSRILAKTADELKHTDIAEHALEVLAQSKVREIWVVGRRGPAQAKFTSKELKEFGELADCVPVIDPAELELGEASRAELEDKQNAGGRKVFELFRSFTESPANRAGSTSPSARARWSSSAALDWRGCGWSTTASAASPSGRWPKVPGNSCSWNAEYCSAASVTAASPCPGCRSMQNAASSLMRRAGSWTAPPRSRNCTSQDG